MKTISIKNEKKNKKFQINVRQKAKVFSIRQLPVKEKKNTQTRRKIEELKKTEKHLVKCANKVRKKRKEGKKKEKKGSTEIMFI